MIFYKKYMVLYKSIKREMLLDLAKKIHGNIMWSVMPSNGCVQYTKLFYQGIKLNKIWKKEMNRKYAVKDKELAYVYHPQSWYTLTKTNRPHNNIFSVKQILMFELCYNNEFITKISYCISIFVNLDDRIRHRPHCQSKDVF